MFFIKLLLEEVKLREKIMIWVSYWLVLFSFEIRICVSPISDRMQGSVSGFGFGFGLNSGCSIRPALLINSIIYAAHSGSTLVAGTCTTWTSPDIGECLFIFLQALLLDSW